jgi:RNA polymerase sigma-70 factor (ECF subfamily)
MRAVGTAERPTGACRPVPLAAPPTTRSLPVADARDFAEFYSASFHSLTVQLYAHTGNLTEAQDVVQEAFCRALAHWTRLAVYDDPAAWVRKVAWNLATNRWRRARRMFSLTGREPDQSVDGPGPDSVVLRQALALLPPRQRQAVVLYYLADAPVTEIAEIIGVSDGTVKSWLHRARGALAAHLDDRNIGALGGGLDV